MVTPPVRSGDILEVRMLVPENQRKQYAYRGVCIARYNKGIRSSFKMYNVYPDGGPVLQVRGVTVSGRRQTDDGSSHLGHC